MHKIFLVFVLFCLLENKSYSASPVKIDSLDNKKFGRIYLYKTTNLPTQIVLFISGDAGWKYGVIDMAKTLAKRNYLVVGINILHYLKNLQKNQNPCYEIASDFDLLNQFVQQKQQLPQLIDPIVAGYSSGATLAYGVIAQALPNTFKGGVGIGFCPDLEIDKPLCMHNAVKLEKNNKINGFNLLPSMQMKLPFAILLGELDGICDLSATKKFMEAIPSGKSFYLPKVGHGYSVQKNWMPQFKQAFDFVVSYSAPAKMKPVIDDKALEKLPINTIIPRIENKTMPLVIFISGDGGWKGLDPKLGQQLADKGAPIAGLDALRYFWNPSSPEKVTADIIKLINYYKSAWNKSEVVFIGYSFGADIIPFVINRLPNQMKSSVKEIVLLSPDSFADFQFHISSWWDHSSKHAYHVLPELKKIDKIPIMCIFGDKEKDTFQQELSNIHCQIVKVPGDHHYNEDISVLAQPILKSLQTLPLP